METKISLKKRMVYTCILILLLFLLLEGIVRLLPINKHVEPVVPVSIGQFDEILGWSLKPSSSGISNRTGSSIEYRINSKGLRDNETSYEKPAGVFRIVLFGDSRTFGFGVPIEKHFSTLLEGYFEEVEVINMGVSGFGVDQMLLYLRSEGSKYAPDLVIAYIAHYGNHRHMYDERFGQPKPRFLIKNGQLVLTNSPVRMNSNQYHVFFRKIHLEIKTFSNFYAILSERLVLFIRQLFSKTLLEPSHEDSVVDEGFRAQLYELGEKLVYAMHEESIMQGAKFLVVTHISELYDASLKKGLFALDVSLALSNAYFSLPDNLEHISECGNGVLAWEIAKFLNKYQLVPLMYLRF